MGGIDGAEQSARQALRAFESSADPAGQLAAHHLLGQALEGRGRWIGAAQHYRRALLLAEHGGWSPSRCALLVRLGSVTAIAGDMRVAQHAIDRAAALARRLDSPSLIAFAGNHAALLATRCGDRAMAARAHRHALDWYLHAGSTSGVAFTAAALARVTAHAHAIELLDRADHAATGTSDPRARAYVLESRALQAREPDAAARALHRADLLRRQSGYPRSHGEQPGIDKLADASL